MDILTKIEKSAFSPLILSYISSIHGSLDMISRGLVNSIHKNNLTNEHVKEIFAKSSFKEEFVERYFDKPFKTPLYGQLQLGSLQKEKLKIDVDKISDFIFERKFYPENTIHQATRILIVTSYEYTKSKKDKSPIWEFFRHIRNAAGHGGKFNFASWTVKKKKVGEPVRRAEWNGIKITQSLQGTELFIDTIKGQGIIYPGDFLLMLMELEDNYTIIKKLRFD